MIRIQPIVLAVLLLTSAAQAIPIDLTITEGFDDGVELDQRIWQPDVSPLLVGRPGDGEVRQVGLRFMATALETTHHVVYARLRFVARGGVLSDSLALTISGVLEIDSPPLSDERRPSLLPRTLNTSTMCFHETWGNGESNQLFYYSNDISSIINEIIGQPGWGQQSEGLILCIDDDSVDRSVTNYLAFSDMVPNRWPATLQVCRNLTETFLGHEIVGRPTDHSATINFASLVSLETFIEYWADGISMNTEPVVVPAGEPVDMVLDGLPVDTLCEYRLHYRLAGTTDEFEVGLTRHFRTQRPPGAPFVFTTQADSHLWESWSAANPEDDHLKLYVRMIDNATADNPDFHLSMGDYSMTEYSMSAQHARDRYLVQRPFLDRMLHSVPFFLVIGNHEGELGFYHTVGDSMPIWAEKSRLDFVPNPSPNGFYSGCSEPSTDGAGMRESYFSWEWGDALMVVLDPFWYTLERPFHNADPAQGGGWAWTLGLKQYDWLQQVITETDRRWKIIFLHHLVGGIDHGNSAYGRGGIEAVKWAVAGNASFEWGGENSIGLDVFNQQRPDFTHGPIHDMLVDADVSMVVSGHDHFYAWQELDDLVYLTVPQPQDRLYQYGGMEAGEYTEGILLPNAGHIRFQVSPEELTVDYIRAFLPGEGQNGLVSDSHTLGASVSEVRNEPDFGSRMLISPNPVGRSTSIRMVARDTGPGELKIHDVAGRLVRVLKAGDDGVFQWNRQNRWGRPVASGVYFATWKRGAEQVTGRMVVVR